MLISQSKCVVRRYKHASTTPNLLPQAIGRKTPDKRNRSPSAMARPASRKAVSSLPAIANIDEQLDEVVMRLPIIGGPLDGKLTIELGDSPPPGYFHLTTRPVNDGNGYLHHYQIVRHSYWRSHGKYEYQGSEDA